MSSFCNVPEQALAAAAGAQCQWPRGSTVRWMAKDPVPGWSIDEFVSTLTDAWKSIQAVCGFKLELVTNERAANILVTTRRIDGPAGVLAEAELPCGNVTSSTQLRVWFDNSEQRWVDAINTSGGIIDLERVACHEFCHSCGLGHAPAGIRDLLAPTVSDLRAPGPWSIPQLVGRYDEPSSKPGPPPSVEPCIGICQSFAKAFDSAEGRRLMSAAAGLLESYTK